MKKSRNVDQISVLTRAILDISASTNLIAVNASIEAARAGAAGAGFSIVAREIRQLADSCTETANNIQEVSGGVTGAVNYLSESARELAGYLSETIMTQLGRSLQAGQQYREDSDYVGHAMEAFNARTTHLKAAMDDIAGSISSISGAIDGAVTDVTGVTGSTRVLVDDMRVLLRAWEPTRKSWWSCNGKWMCFLICKRTQGKEIFAKTAHRRQRLFPMSTKSLPKTVCNPLRRKGLHFCVLAQVYQMSTRVMFCPEIRRISGLFACFHNYFPAVRVVISA